MRESNFYRLVSGMFAAALVFTFIAAGESDFEQISATVASDSVIVFEGETGTAAGGLTGGL